MDLDVVDNKKDAAVILPCVSIRLVYSISFSYELFGELKMFSDDAQSRGILASGMQDTKYNLIKVKLDCSIKTSKSVIDSDVQRD